MFAWFPTQSAATSTALLLSIAFFFVLFETIPQFLVLTSFYWYDKLTHCRSYLSDLLWTHPFRNQGEVLSCPTRSHLSPSHISHSTVFRFGIYLSSIMEGSRRSSGSAFRPFFRSCTATCLLGLIACVNARGPPLPDVHLSLSSLDWSLSNANKSITVPTPFVNQAHLALLDAGIIDEPNIGLNEGTTRWVGEEKAWTWQTTIDLRSIFAWNGVDEVRFHGHCFRSAW